MINLLSKILNNQNLEQDKESNKNLELLCGLMVEAAYTDGQIDQNEINNIKFSLINVFKENAEEVDTLLISSCPINSLETLLICCFIFFKLKKRAFCDAVDPVLTTDQFFKI